jgi:thymidylate synthase ThyX
MNMRNARRQTNAKMAVELNARTWIAELVDRINHRYDGEIKPVIAYAKKCIWAIEYLKPDFSKLKNDQ